MRPPQGCSPIAGPQVHTREQLGIAWQNIEYGRASVDQALDRVQQLVDAKQKVLHAQSGM